MPLSGSTVYYDGLGASRSPGGVHKPCCYAQWPRNPILEQQGDALCGAGWFENKLVEPIWVVSINRGPKMDPNIPISFL